MKYTHFLLLPFICLLLTSCSDDDKPGKEDEDRSETLSWIEEKLRDRYYWSDKIPENPTYTVNPGEDDINNFFTSLLYKTEDGKIRNNTHYYYSTINKVSTTRYIDDESTYGFEFSSVYIKEENIYAVIVLYVLPNTPAEKVLKRGDWITHIDGQALTPSSIGTLYGSDGKTFTIAQWSSSQNTLINHNDIQIEAAQSITPNPIFLSTTISSGGKQVGYLVYNSFKSGTNDTDNTYNNQLRALSNADFSNLDEFVLDLRYNGGGLLTCAQLVCAILGPKAILNESQLGYLEYNDKQKTYFSAGTKELGSGKNLNLNRLFVLVSSSSASASEAVINLLDPLMQVVVIGRTTEGKNLGSNTYTSSDNVWEMHPITCKIFNKEGESNYADGWLPNIDKGDVFDYDNQGYVTLQDHIYELGDPNERLLMVALEAIGGNTYKALDSRSGGTTGVYTEGVNSLERKISGSVIVD